MNLFSNIQNKTIHKDFINNGFYVQYMNLIESYKHRNIMLHTKDKIFYHHYLPDSIQKNNNVVAVTYDEHKYLHELLVLFSINSSLIKMKKANNMFNDVIKTNTTYYIWVTPLGEFTSLKQACEVMKMKEYFLNRICDQDIEFRKNWIKLSPFFANYNGVLVGRSSTSLGFKKIDVTEINRKTHKNSKWYKVPWSNKVFYSTTAAEKYLYEKFGIILNRRTIAKMCNKNEDNLIPVKSVNNKWFQHWKNPELFLGLCPFDFGFDSGYIYPRLF